MTYNELINHDWKEGEIVYVIAERRILDLGCTYHLPLKVIRAKVDSIFESNNGWISLHLRPCNKKYTNYLPAYNLYCSTNTKASKWEYDSDSCKKVYFTKQEALDAYDKDREDFIKNVRSEVHKSLVSRLNALDYEKQKIFNIFHMTIMKEQ